MDVNVAVVGVGYWGKNLARNFAQLGALYAVCDEHPPTLERIAAQHKPRRATTSYDELLADPEVVGVVLATPAVKHFAHAKAALLAGKDVLVEKPLALREQDGRELLELAREHGRILMVGHVLDYHPAVRLLTELVQRGELGALRYVYSNRLNLGKARTEENILWSFAPHDISIILSLVGAPPEVVTASGADYLTEGVPDVTVSTLAFPGGVRAHIFVSWLHPHKEQRLVVIGDKKMAVFDDTAREGKLKLYDKGIEQRGGALVTRQTAETTLFFDETEPLRIECEAFLTAVADRKPPRTDGLNGLRVLQVLAACQASLEQGGMPVKL